MSLVFFWKIWVFRSNVQFKIDGFNYFIQKVGEATATSKPAAISNRCYWRHMTQLCHRGIDWCALRSMNVACISTISKFVVFKFRTRQEIMCRITCVSCCCCCCCREVAMNEKLIVQMDGKRTRIFNTKVDNLACASAFSSLAFLERHICFFIISFTFTPCA